MVCNPTRVAVVLCSIIFPRSNWSTNRIGGAVRYDISRHGHTIATGSVTIRHGRVTVRSPRLRPGRYLLTITIRNGTQQRTLLVQTVSIHSPHRASAQTPARLPRRGA